MPQDTKAREKWIASIKTHQTFSNIDEKTIYYSVCSNHFESSEMYSGKNVRLKPEACPTIYPRIYQTAAQTEEIAMNDDQSAVSIVNEVLPSSSLPKSIDLNTQ